MGDQLKVRCSGFFLQQEGRVETPLSSMHYCFYEANHEGKHRNPNGDEWE